MSRMWTYIGVFLMMLGLGAGAAPAQVQDEEQTLRAQEQQLTEKVRSLRREQKLLLLRKTLASSDSKYLSLDLRAGEGALWYRTRILRTFRFTLRGKVSGQVAEGSILSLTGKNDSGSVQRRLSFGNADLVIEGKDNRGAHGGALYISLGRKDLAALYYALEAGSLAFFAIP